jgi:hypothetical protein
MKSATRILVAAFAIALMSVAAKAGPPTVTQASSACNATLYDFVTTPEPVVYGAGGTFMVNFGNTNIVDVGNCRHLYFEIGPSKATGYSVIMGKIAGAVLADQVLSGTSFGHIQSQEIKGPQFDLVLQGPANTKDSVQIWVYLTN